MKTSVTSRLKASLLVSSLLLLVAGGADAATKTYRYYRFTPTKLRDTPNIANSIQLSEFRFILSGTPLPTTGVTVSNVGGNNPANESPPNVYDGNTATKYLDFNKLTPLDFDFGVPTSIDSYNFATANDAPERDPVSWVFYGSTDGTNFVPLDIQKNFTGTTTRQVYEATPFVIPVSLDPVITSFTSTTAAVSPTPVADVINGTAVELDWHVDLADLVTIDQGVGTVTATGSTTVTPPPNSITTYTITGKNTTTGVSSTGTVTIKTVAGGAVTYQYVRFTPVHLRDDVAANSIQIADLYFVSGGIPVAYLPEATATNPGGSNTPDANEGALKAIDGLTGTKWLDFNKKPLVVDFSVPTTFDAYVINTANDAIERDPVRWVLEGSADGTNFVAIDDMTKFNFPIPTARGVDTQDIPLPGASLSAPISSFSTDAGTLVSGEPAILSWSTSLADSVTIDNGVGTVSANGSVTVNPTVTTTYTLTTIKAGASNNTAQLTITVINPTNTTINYPTFDNAGSELVTVNDASVLLDNTRTLPGAFKRLRLTEDAGSKIGAAWFAKRLDFSQGFDTTFDLSFITLSGGIGADGIGFTIQNNGNSMMTTSPEDKGFATNSFTVNFDSYINAPEPSAATLQIVTNKTVLTTVDLAATVDGSPVFPGVLATGSTDLSQNTAGATPYHVRVTYVSGKLNVYMNDVQVLTDFAVDLAATGALDAGNKGYVGFTGRTGGLYEAHDVTSWVLSTSPGVEPTNPLAITSYTINAAAGTGTLNWSSNTGKTYRITSSSDLATWTSLKTAIASGGATTSSNFTFTPGTKGFFRVEQE
jgi:hypothetical protein